jgi:hypothetical protein
MKHRVTLVFLAFFFGLLLVSFAVPAKAQVPENSTLHQSILRMDQQLFELGFNQCKLDVVANLSDEHLEFFHDKGGMQNRTQFLLAMKNNVCGNPEGKPVRILIAASTKIFALENNGVLYGAVQQGEHRFQLKGKDTAKDGYTLAKFTHVWLLKNGKWMLKSAISYDHQQKFEKMALVPAVKKPVPKPYTVFDLNIAPYTLRLQHWAAN